MWMHKPPWAPQHDEKGKADFYDDLERFEDETERFMNNIEPPSSRKFNNDMGMLKDFGNRVGLADDRILKLSRRFEDLVVAGHDPNSKLRRRLASFFKERVALLRESLAVFNSTYREERDLSRWTLEEAGDLRDHFSSKMKELTGLSPSSDLDKVAASFAEDAARLKEEWAGLTEEERLKRVEELQRETGGQACSTMIFFQIVYNI